MTDSYYDNLGFFTREDCGKMDALAMWHDLKDNESGYIGPREVQQDLRRWAAIATELVLEAEYAAGIRKEVEDGRVLPG